MAFLLQWAGKCSLQKRYHSQQKEEIVRDQCKIREFYLEETEINFTLNNTL